MHYCLMLFTKDCPSKNDIDNIMQKYNYDNVYSDDEKEIEYPQFTYDWYEIGGRYNGDIKLKVDKENEIYKWQYFVRKKRNGRLFWSYLLSEMEEFSKKSFMYNEENYFCSMGFRDGFLYVDGAKISDILNYEDLDCYTFIGIDGEAYSREWWNGKDFIQNEDFEERLMNEKEKSKDLFITIIDYHN